MEVILNFNSSSPSLRDIPAELEFKLKIDSRTLALFAWACVCMFLLLLVPRFCVELIFFLLRSIGRSHAL